MESVITPKPKAGLFQPVPEIEAELQTTLPWLFHPAFIIGPNEGYDGRRFGSRAGPSECKSVKNVLHEVSHAIEMSLLPSRIWKRRVKQDMFDMRIRSSVVIGGERYYEPRTMQATERECRVGGIQLRLLEAGGYETEGFLREFVIVLRHMEDWCFGGTSPCNTYGREYSEDQKRWIQLREDLVMSAYERFSLPDIQGRWDQVMTWLGKAH